MYAVWQVTFRIRSDNRGPCDPLYQAEPPEHGSVGDSDPFSDAFGTGLTNVEDSLRLRSTRCEQASSLSSDISDFNSLQSSVQDSPSTSNTDHSTLSRPEACWSATRQLYYQPTSPNLCYDTRNIESPPSPHSLTHHLDTIANTAHDPLPTCGDRREDDPANVGIVPSAGKVESESTKALQPTRAPTIKRDRRKKPPLPMTRRPLVKTREEHLSANKAAASRCRQQRKAWEKHLQDTSLMLQASINASKSSINELGIELASLKRQIWECPSCTDRYVYSLGPGLNEMPSYMP
jgi:hypothetical protein